MPKLCSASKRNLSILLTQLPSQCHSPTLKWKSIIHPSGRGPANSFPFSPSSLVSYAFRILSCGRKNLHFSLMCVILKMMNSITLNDDLSKWRENFTSKDLTKCVPNVSLLPFLSGWRCYVVYIFTYEGHQERKALTQTELSSSYSVPSI